MTKPNPNSELQCREAFEAWIYKNGHYERDLERYVTAKLDVYNSSQVEASWQGFQAAWALPREVGEDELARVRAAIHTAWRNADKCNASEPETELMLAKAAISALTPSALEPEIRNKCMECGLQYSTDCKWKECPAQAAARLAALQKPIKGER